VGLILVNIVVESIIKHKIYSKSLPFPLVSNEYLAGIMPQKKGGRHISKIGMSVPMGHF
jgi:hypothetical protein